MSAKFHSPHNIGSRPLQPLPPILSLGVPGLLPESLYKVPTYPGGDGSRIYPLQLKESCNYPIGGSQGVFLVPGTRLHLSSKIVDVQATRLEDVEAGNRPEHKQRHI